MSSETRGKEEKTEEVNPYRELALYFGGLFLMFLGFIISLTVVGIIFGLPMLIAGYAIYKSSELARETEEGVKMDYREKND